MIKPVIDPLTGMINLVEQPDIHGRGGGVIGGGGGAVDSVNGQTGAVTLTKSDVGLGNVDNTSNATERAATATLTNKRISKRVLTITSSATPSIDTDSYDAVTITAQAAAITSMTTNLTGSPNNFDQLLIRIKDDGTGRSITWGASFQSGSATLPTTTTSGKTLMVGLIWDSVDSKWTCEATGSRT